MAEGRGDVPASQAECDSHADLRSLPPISHILSIAPLNFSIEARRRVRSVVKPWRAEER